MFFFSSRRRHTRLQGDWSSDVCSSDLVDAIMRVINDHADKTGKKIMYAFNISDEVDEMERNYQKIFNTGGTCAMISLNSRSEERRVGKECRLRHAKNYIKQDSRII